jgi:hypothetical protein
LGVWGAKRGILEIILVEKSEILCYENWILGYFGLEIWTYWGCDFWGFGHGGPGNHPRFS